MNNPSPPYMFAFAKQEEAFQFRVGNHVINLATERARERDRGKIICNFQHVFSSQTDVLLHFSSDLLLKAITDK